MCCPTRHDHNDLENHLRDLECQIALQRDAVESLRSTGRDASKAILGLAMLSVMLRQSIITRDATRLAATISGGSLPQTSGS